MTVTYLGNSQWMGLSTDTKPTGIATGSSFRETDLNHIKYYDGSFWRVSRFGLPSSRKVGWWTALGSTGVGLLASNTTGGAPATISGVTDGTNGRGANYATSTTQNTYTGIRGGAAIVIRQWNPIFRVKFKLAQTNSGNVMRFFTGFATNTTALPNSDDPLNGINGIGILINSTDTTFTIGHNDNAGATVQTAITGTPAIDTALHTVEIIADDANTRFGVSWDGGVYQYISSGSNIPTQTGPMNVHASMYNPTTTSVSFDLYWGEVESDK